MSNDLALYTTVYPGAESSCLPGMSRSLRKQIATLISRSVLIRSGPAKCSVPSGMSLGRVGDCSAGQYAGRSSDRLELTQFLASANKYQGIVFVDCDDVMHPTRVESARTQLQNSDIAGCAMEIVKEDGQSTGLLFGPVSPAAIPQMLARVNVFGMSNTAYRTDVLREIPPSPPQGRLMDWFLATAGWVRGARFSFDNTPRMKYRQYGNNTARVLPPFTTEYIRVATDLVLGHYELVLSQIPGMTEGIRRELESARANVQLFSSRIAESSRRL